MKVIDQPKESILFGAFFLIWVVKENQIGTGVLTFQRDLMNIAGQDAWIPVLLSGLVAHLVAFVMVRTLERYPSTDLYGIHYDLFGKWLGAALSGIYIVYLLSIAMMILRRYTEIISVWIFPNMPIWILELAILFLVNYAILGGIRVIVGFCFFSFLLSIWTVLILGFNLKYMAWRNLLPILEHDVNQLLEGTYSMIFAVVGFEIIYFIYPFVKEKQKVLRFTHIGILSTTVIYLIAMVISIGYFSFGEVNLSASPTLRLYKSIEFHFIERMEFVIVSLWIIIIMPNLLLFIWAATRGMKRVFGWKQKHALYLFSLLIFIGSLFMETRQDISSFSQITNQLALYLVFIYPLLLYAFVWMKHRLAMKKGGKNA